MNIKLDRSICISCGSCAAVCPLFFEMLPDGKSDLKDATKDSEEREVLEVFEPGCAKEAADICPVQAIKIEE